MPDEEPRLELDRYENTDNREDPELTGGGPETRTPLAMTALRSTAGTLTRQKKRDWLGEWAYYLAKHRVNIGYRQYRPVNVSRPLTVVAREYVTLDCSSMIQWLYARGNAAFRRSGGLPDPSGYGHSGYGNSYTQEAHGRKVSVPAKGDIAFYNGHVGIVVRSNSRQPHRSIIVSHGSTIGPLVLEANYRGDLHGFRRYF